MDLSNFDHQAIADFFLNLLEIVGLFLENLWFAVKGGLAVFVNIPKMFDWLPSEVLSVLLSIVSLTIVLNITKKD